MTASQLVPSLQFLADPRSGFRIDYPQLAEDLIAGRASGISQIDSEGLERSLRDYRQLVFWLGQIVRHQPEVVWPEAYSTNEPPPTLPPITGQTADSLRNLRWDSSDFQMDAWRSAFLGSTSRIALRTSGSSGTAKQFWHRMDSLTRGVRLSDRQRTSVWGWAYPPDHLAGMQVFFQALLNVNPLIQLFGLSSAEIHQAIESYSITHLSCTPTFIRLLVADGMTHPKLLRITSGGERLDAQTLHRVHQVFPNARLTNIYASTEVGPLLVSHDDGFVVPNDLIDQVRIVDGQLWLHRCLRVDQQVEKSDSTIDEHSPEELLDFWPTGDQVEIVDENPLKIRFLSRCHEGFNVAGYRVDPVKLENIARNHPRVADAKFYGIPNSVTEHLIACDLVAKNGESPLADAELRAWMVPQLARHEVPRIIRWVSAIETTNTGKVKRL